MQTLPTAALYESPTNPRKTSDPTKQAELEQSVREQGILQALLVRKRPQNGHTHEVVLGSRRLRAARNLGLEVVPVDVRDDMTDDQVELAQEVENLQREDLHPLDEADGFNRLLDRMVVEEVAAKVGRSSSYVYQRLKLCALTPLGRKAFFDGALTAATALIVARIPDPNLQDKAVKDLVEDATRYGEPMPAARASSYVQRTYMLRLKDAPFKPNDAALVPEAGACVDCPKRTGSQPDLFADIEDRDDMCTDPACFERKRTAEWERRKEAAAAKGVQVVEKAAEVKQLFPHGTSNVTYNAPYVALTDYCSGDPKSRTYKQLLGRGAAKAIVRAPNGDIVELIPKAEVKKLLKEAGHTFAAANSKGSSSSKKPAKSKAEREAAKLSAEVEEKALDRVVGELVSRVEKQKAGPALWKLLGTMAVEVIWMANTFAMKRRGMERKFTGKQPKAADQVAGLSEAQCRGLVFEALMAEPFRVDDPELQALCKELGVDSKAITAAVKAELEPAVAPPPAKASKAAGKSKGRPKPASPKSASKKAGR